MHATPTHYAPYTSQCSPSVRPHPTALAHTAAWHGYVPCGTAGLYAHPTTPAALWVQLTPQGWYTSTGHKGASTAALAQWCHAHTARS